MKIVIDTDTGKLMVAGPQGVQEFPLTSPEGSKLLRQLSLSGRNSISHDAAFTWAGQPVQEDPAVLFRLQEAIHLVRPQILVHTGRTTAGSLLYLAHTMRQFGGERVLSIDGGVAPEKTLVAAQIQFLTSDRAGQDALPQDQSATARILLVLGESGGKPEMLERLEGYSARLPMGSAILSLELLSAGELHAKHAAEALAEFAMEHPEYRGEFLPGNSGTGLAPLLIRMRA